MAPAEVVQAERFTWWRGIRGSSLSPTARHVALTLSTYMDKDGTGAWPSMATLADDTGRSRRTVARAIDELEAAGFLSVKSGGGRRPDGGYVSNRYVATIPVSGVMGDSDDTGDTAEDASAVPPHTPGAVSSEHGAVSSQQGAVSSETGSSVTGGTQAFQELASQSSKHHSAPKAPAPNGANVRIKIQDLEKLRDLIAIENGHRDFKSAPASVRNRIDGEARHQLTRGAA